MTYIGTVRNGHVELPADAALADGTVVRVEPVPEEPDPADCLSDLAVDVDPVYRLHELAVDADLPSDLSAQHDHYIYGTRKRKE